MSDLHNKRNIFHVAADLFSRKGYNGVSIQEICELAGVTKPTLYYYFKSKKNLYSQLISESINSFEKYAGLSVRKDLDFFSNMERVLIEIKRFVQDNPDYTRFIIRLHFVNLIEEEKMIDEEFHVERFRKLKDFFMTGIESGDLAKDLDIDLACAFFVNTTNFLVTHILKKTKFIRHNDPDLIKNLTSFLKKMYT